MGLGGGVQGMGGGCWLDPKLTRKSPVWWALRVRCKINELGCFYDVFMAYALRAELMGGACRQLMTFYGAR